MTTFHLQILLGPMIAEDAWPERDWRGFDPSASQTDLWFRNREVWAIRDTQIAQFWHASNHVVTLVHHHQVQAVAQVTAMLRVEHLDTERVAAKYESRWALRGIPLVDHQLVGQPWVEVAPGTRRWPVQVVAGRIDPEAR